MTGVKVYRHSKSKARVKVKLTCPRGARYSLSLELLQDKTPDAAPLDAYYTGTRVIEGQCSGHKKRLKLTAVVDTSGAFAPPDGRLRKGPVEVVLGGTVADEFTILDASARAR